MFKIGICIFDKQKTEEMYVWIMKWSLRQAQRVKVVKYKNYQQIKFSRMQIILLDEAMKDDSITHDHVIYISKDIDKDNLYERLSRAYREYLSDEKSYVYYNRPRYIKQSLKNVIYFTSNKRKVIMHCVDGEHEFYGSLDMVEEEIRQKKETFIRTHQSHLINRDYIRQYTVREAILKNGEILTISKTRKKNAKIKFYNLSPNEIYKRF